MRKVVPEIITYYCDSCGIEITGRDKRLDCKIVMTSAGLDHSSHAVGPGRGGIFECCGKCYSEIFEKLKIDN